MKYVRTKDNRILKYGEQTDKGFNKGIFEIHNIDNNAFAPIEVLKEADTIEELCDIGVVVNDTTKKVVSIAKEIAPDKYKWRKDTFTIYGAIWTDKGLIYVAKLNDKGELELI